MSIPKVCVLNHTVWLRKSVSERLFLTCEDSVRRSVVLHPSGRSPGKEDKTRTFQDPWERGLVQRNSVQLPSLLYLSYKFEAPCLPKLLALFHSTRLCSSPCIPWGCAGAIARLIFFFSFYEPWSHAAFCPNPCCIYSSSYLWWEGKPGLLILSGSSVFTGIEVGLKETM